MQATRQNEARVPIDAWAPMLLHVKYVQASAPWPYGTRNGTGQYDDCRHALYLHARCEALEMCVPAALR
jgi:hypothetical protein